MAIVERDEFFKLFGVLAKDKRFENWLLLRLFWEGMTIDNTIGRSSIRDAMVERIRKLKWDIENIKNAYRLNVLPMSHLDWVEDDRWQSVWISMPTLDPRFSEPAWPTYKDRSIAIIDSVSVNNKANWVDGLKLSWVLQAQKDLAYDWFFDEDKEEKLRLLADYVTKQSPADERTCFANRYDVLFYFNRRTTEFYGKVCFYSIKKQWSQIKYRRSLKGKKQYNFVLSDASIKALDRMAEENLLSRAQILQILIQSEKKNKKGYISEWMKGVKSLE